MSETQRYRLEVHTLTGDIHATEWARLAPEEVLSGADELREMVDAPIRIGTPDGSQVVVPARQIASARYVPEGSGSTPTV